MLTMGRGRLATEVEVIGLGEINTVFERLARRDVKYRFVIDVGRR